MPEQPKVYVELLIQIDGSLTQNKLCTFELPVLEIRDSGNKDEPGMIQFESKTLVREAKKALDRLVK